VYQGNNAERMGKSPSVFFRHELNDHIAVLQV